MKTNSMTINAVTLKEIKVKSKMVLHWSCGSFSLMMTTVPLLDRLAGMFDFK